MIFYQAFYSANAFEKETEKRGDFRSIDSKLGAFFSSSNSGIIPKHTREKENFSLAEKEKGLTYSVDDYVQLLNDIFRISFSKKQRN